MLSPRPTRRGDSRVAPLTCVAADFLRVAVGVVLWGCLLGVSRAQQPVFSLDGEALTKTAVATSPGGDKVLEFVRASEDFERWSKLVAFRQQRMPVLDNEPKLVAQTIADAIRRRYPKALVEVFDLDKDGEASVEFVATLPERNLLEYNLFRYVRGGDGRSVVSLQMAYRGVEAGGAGSEPFRRLRAAWLMQAGAFDMTVARSTLAQLR